MPLDPTLPKSMPTARPHSPDAASGGERKRRRKVLSCYDCRRRKLQCDRAMPACSRCTKADQTANCLYIDDAAGSQIRNPDPVSQPCNETLPSTLDNYYGHPPKSLVASGDLLSKLKYQERRIRELEATLAQTNHSLTQQSRTTKLPLTPESIDCDVGERVNATDRETVLLRGKSFKTQFHGISYPGSLIAYIPEFSTFTKETFEKFPALFRIRKELMALEDRTEYSGVKPQPTTDLELKALLPSKAETDYLVQLYLDNYDCIYHIIHLPSFRQEYNKMKADLPNARPHFIAILLLMTASAQCP